MAHAIPLWNIPSLAVKDSKDLFPVRRIFCVGRNYVEHQKEMGGDGREQPFFFLKSEFSLVAGGGEVHYPPNSANYHYETEMVVAIAKGGRRIAAKDANGQQHMAAADHRAVGTASRADDDLLTVRRQR